MVYKSKVLGTRYYISLTTRDSNWYLQLTMDDAIEDEVIIPLLNNDKLTNSFDQLIQTIPVNLSEIEQNRILQELRNQIKGLVEQSGGSFPAGTLTGNEIKQQTEQTMSMQQAIVSEYRDNFKVEQKVPKAAPTSKPRQQDKPAVQTEPKKATPLAAEASSQGQSFSQLQVKLEMILQKQSQFEVQMEGLENRMQTLERITKRIAEITDKIITR